MGAISRHHPTVVRRDRFACMNDDLSRYQRQMQLPGFGEDGQRRLADATAVILGCGALGCVVADMLARAGVGHLVIIDRDFIEITNLQRQVLFDEADVLDAIPKAVAAERRLAEINSAVKVTAVIDDINHTNIERLTAGADILVDGLDNFETRYLANDLAVKNALPYVYGAAVGTTGMAFTVLPHAPNAPWQSGDDLATPCFRCLFEEAPAPGTSATCETAGVIGPAVGIVANFEACEALKILTGNFERVSRTLLNIDLWANEFFNLKVSNAREKGDCPCCKHRRFDYLDGKSGSNVASLCGRNAVQLRFREDNDSIDFGGLEQRLRPLGSVTANDFMLRAQITDSGTPYEITLFPDGRAIIKGTDEPAAARSIYAKYIGT